MGWDAMGWDPSGQGTFDGCGQCTPVVQPRLNAAKEEDEERRKTKEEEGIPFFFIFLYCVYLFVFLHFYSITIF